MVVALMYQGRIYMLSNSIITTSNNNTNTNNTNTNSKVILTIAWSHCMTVATRTVASSLMVWSLVSGRFLLHLEGERMWDTSPSN